MISRSVDNIKINNTNNSSESEISFHIVNITNINTFLQKVSPSNNLTLIGATQSLLLISLFLDFNDTNNLQTILSNKKIGYLSSDFNNPQFLKDFLAFYLNISNIKLTKFDRVRSDCLIGSFFEFFDAIILSDFQFPLWLRKNRYTNMKRNNLLSANDFSILSLGSFEFLFSLNQRVMNDTTIVRDSLIENKLSDTILEMNQHVNDDNLMTCDNNFLNHDYSLLRSVHSFLNITEKDIQLISKYNLNNIFKIDMNYYNSVINKLFVTNQVNQSITNIEILNVRDKMFPSTCFYCRTTTCAYQTDPYDPSSQDFTITYYMLIIIGIIYYIFFFISIFKLKMQSLKGRLLVPYILPFTVICWGIYNNTYIYSVCTYLTSLFSFATILLMASLYGTTLFRYFYLRNLYKILSKVKKENIAIFKRVASYSVGIWLTFIISVMSVILLSIPFILIEYYLFLTSEISFISTVIYGLVAAICCGFCLIFVFCDIILNLKTIKLRGLRYYFFFDDPFYVRIDLLSIFVLFVTLILYSFVRVYIFFEIARLIVGVSVYLIFGGTTMIIEFIKILRKKEKITLEKEQLLLLIENDLDFCHLLREFAEKEFSLENLICFEKINNLRKKGNDFNVDIEVLEEIKKDFIDPYSKFELNIPGRVKSHFLDLYTNFKNQKVERVTGTTIYELFSVHLLYNINDTFFRLQQTSEYENWQIASTIKQNN